MFGDSKTENTDGKPKSLKDISGTPLTTIQNLLTEMDALKKIVASQGEVILSLKNRVDEKDAEILSLKNLVNFNDEKTNALLCVKDRICDELQMQLDKLHQYTRRPCVTIAGIPKHRGEKKEQLKVEIEKIIASTEADVTMRDIDKFHRNGPVDGNNQDVIMRFNSHTAKELFYKKRKSVDIGYPIYIKPNLCDSVKDELSRAKKFLSNFDPYKCMAQSNPPEFVMADVWGNLLLKMKNRSSRGLFIPFMRASDLPSLILEAQPNLDRYERDMATFDSSDDE